MAVQKRFRDEMKNPNTVQLCRYKIPSNNSTDATYRRGIKNIIEEL